MMPGGNKGMSEPPTGAIVGESVPRGYDEAEMQESAVEELAGLLAGHPAYADKTDSERRDAAREMLR